MLQGHYLPPHFDREDLDPCRPCPPQGAVCLLGQIQAEQGWWLSPTQTAAYRCPNTVACGNNGTCGENRVAFAQNPLCGACTPGFNEWRDVCEGLQCRSNPE